MHASARWLRYKAMAVKRPPLLRPSHQPLIVPALPLKAPPQEPFHSFPRRLDARIGGTHERLSQVLEAVGRVGGSVDAEIKVL